MDVLSDAIAVMRTGVPHSSRTCRSAPWGMRFPASEGAGFHVVLQGSCWLLPPEGGEPLALSAGDVVFLAQGGAYGLADAPDTPLVPVVRRGEEWVWEAPQEPGGGPTTLLLCGAYRLSRARPHPLLAELPPVVHLPARIGAHRALRGAVDLLGGELEAPGPGSDAAIPALLDTLLLYILRAWLADHSEQATTGWAAALADPAIADALDAIHRDPAHPWTVAELGRLAGLSRAAFARRFATVVGQPPLAYLTWWRMTVAGRLLDSTDAPLRVVAQRSGYSSEFAFAKAFRRELGMSPGQYRNGERPGAERSARTGARSA
ncbi:helix-turn-helix domain-containing protein [Streptomyces sp. 3MP-14]|uniref:Helix-turn-helix domain-containing protein n=1 Tax=Streptomyces mimosae TaxID=2586635 RepID=A0A5N6AG38_9ACTN|nr:MULTISPECIES: AraC family transcriptional regulator [Streptomyces]KAB8167684.1 helix-turn-helix domain-containing protein [Streptomyces mimosae]KAB8177668.1 helix-turn-helix domain-containing protein [Streptomyces sp. 3MP-14]